VTVVTCLFIIQEIKEKENKRKREIKSKKIDKRKENTFTIHYNLVECHMQVYLSRNYIPMVKSSPKTYKPAFHSGHLSHNTSYGGAATIQVFCLP